MLSSGFTDSQGARPGVRPSLTRVPAHAEIATDIDYDQLGRLLEASPLSPTPSEAQGILCGLACAADPDPERTWLGQMLPASGPESAAGGADLPVTELAAGLRDLARHTLAEIQGSGLGLTVLLPDESRPLVERATGLYDWVRGFLFALGLRGLSEPDLSAQGREVLRDFTNLTRMDLDAVADGEEDEQALTELTEFVWVAAMLIYEERVPARQEAR